MVRKTIIVDANHMLLFELVIFDRDLTWWLVIMSGLVNYYLF